MAETGGVHLAPQSLKGLQHTTAHLVTEARASAPSLRIPLIRQPRTDYQPTPIAG